MPASFDRSSREPDEIVRRVRLTVCSEDPKWKRKLLETYDTSCDRFEIAPFTWYTSCSLDDYLVILFNGQLTKQE